MAGIFVYFVRAGLPYIFTAPRLGPSSGIIDREVVQQVAVIQLGKTLGQMEIFITTVEAGLFLTVFALDN